LEKKEKKMLMLCDYAVPFWSFFSFGDTILFLLDHFVLFI